MPPCRVPSTAPAPPSPALAERARLLALLRQVGPDAPTLCAGWTAHDLAAHLVARERQPLAAPGLVVPLLHRVTERFERAARARPYDDLLAVLRDGPPRLSLARLGDVAELHEWYVHGEDVRRLVEPGPRVADRALQDALWARLAVMVPALLARARGLGVVLRTPDRRERRARRGRQEVVLAGEPTELVLWLSGRRAVAAVDVQGAPAAVALAATVRLGW